MMLLRTVIATVCVAALISPFVFADEGLSQKLAPQLRLAAPDVREPVHIGAEETPADPSEKWDVIVLKNGNRIEGWILKEDDDKTLLERRSSRGDRFYTAGISKTQIARIVRLAPEAREAQQQERRTDDVVQAQAPSQPRPNVATQSPTQRAMAPRGNLVNAAHVGALAGAARGIYGATPYSTGFGPGYGATGYGAAAYGGAGYGAGAYGAGGYGAGGFGGGAYGAGGYGGGYGGGFGGGGPFIFTNILQLCQPVNHRLVGEVEPVIGLAGQRAGTNQTAVAGR